METLEDKQKYVAADARVFPHAPRSVDEIAFHLNSWQGGTPITAFDQDGAIAGSIMAYWFTPHFGFTEDIFVIPVWRRKGLARHMIAEAIQFLQEQGIDIVGLEVLESNPATRLYLSLGYEVQHREIQMNRLLKEENHVTIS
jgi:ribosomal protein S18 acetylase RimI-like enzyme